MKLEDVKSITILGSGAMGHGIAQVCIDAGFDVIMRDIKQEFIDNGVAKIKDSFAFLVGKGKKSQADMDAAMARLTTTTDLKEALKGAKLVIEAVPEIMELKKSVFKEVSDLVDDDVIIATNTSTMSISEIATVVKNPARFVGMHFFNPVNRMKLVEVIYGEKTSDETVDILCEVSKKYNKVPVKVLKDRPGFIVNRISAPNQAFISAMLDSGTIVPDEVDTTMKAMGQKMGPFEIADFVGIDVFSHTLEYYSETLSKEFKPGKYLTDKMNKKELGMKTGKGIYTWVNGKAVIDGSKTSAGIGPMEFAAIQINEAVRVFKEGIAQSTKDIDDAVKFGMNAFIGPFELAASMDPKQLTDTLNNLSTKFGLDILKPEPEVVDGSFKTMGK
ncbi:MAG: 3-hydroxyacyl-CoA dehydrogenase family protein [Proteobacteria bacterium]|nr:3-hydroxyacyl-CoA dehydrogenase family protein [Pseudomonadota bacterium]